VGRKKIKPKPKPKERKNDPFNWYPLAIGVGLVVLVLFFILREPPETEQAQVAVPEPDVQERSETDDEHESDFIESAASIDANWGEPVATSPKGDQEFLVVGADYHEVYIAQDAETFSFLVTLHEQVGEEVEYEFYIISENYDYQLRIDASQGAVLWKRNGPEVTMIEPPEGFDFTVEEDSISARFPKSLFMDDDKVRLFVEIFYQELFAQENDAEAAHDSGQFDPIEIGI
jgi:hypothetical protein